MIAVIADDFTGAAEIGGIGLKYGLNTVIQTVTDEMTDADLLIISTDTRSGTVKNSVDQTEMITRNLIRLSPQMIYKKLDSVLRGNVADELLAQMKVEGKKRAIVVAGNPNLGRTIRNGICYINDVPVADTFFAGDPEFPVYSSRVTEIVGVDRPEVFSVSPGQSIPGKGLVFGDVSNEEDMKKWASKIDKNTIPAGGAGFFDILLGTKFQTCQEVPDFSCRLGQKVLFVFGSAYPKDPDFMLLLRQQGFILMDIPEELYSNQADLSGLTDFWSDKIIRTLAANRKVILSVGQSANNNMALSSRIRESMGLAVSRIFEKTTVDDLLIEGGSTTSVILRYLEITKLYPYQELGSGVIRMKTDKYPGLRVTTKPGSYLWPDCLITDKNRKIKIKHNSTIHS
jgi:D-threonate/D-erythronate kinase